MFKLSHAVVAATALVLMAGQAGAIDLSGSASGAGSVAASVGGTSVDASGGGSFGANVASSAGVGASAGGSVGGSAGGTVNGTVGGGTGGFGIAATGSANVAGSAAGSAQVRNLQVFTSNGVNVGTAVNLTNDSLYIAIEPAADFVTGVHAFNVAAASASTANGRITLGMTDGALRAALAASAVSNGTATIQ